MISEDEEETIGQRILFHRKKLGYTQDMLAELSNVGGGTQISKYEKNIIQPSLDILASISKAMNVSIDLLYTGNKKEYLFDDIDFKKTLAIALKFPISKKTIIREIIKDLDASIMMDEYATMRARSKRELDLSLFE